MRVDILANYLAEKGLGRVGKSIFAHSMPAECEEGLLIKLPLEGVDIDQYIPGRYQAEIDVIVRAKSQEKGQAMTEQVMETLKLYNKAFIDPKNKKVVLQIQQMLPLTLPIRFPRLDGNGIEFSICFHTTYIM